MLSRLVCPGSCVRTGQSQPSSLSNRRIYRGFRNTLRNGHFGRFGASHPQALVQMQLCVLGEPAAMRRLTAVHIAKRWSCFREINACYEKACAASFCAMALSVSRYSETDFSLQSCSGPPPSSKTYMQDRHRDRCGCKAPSMYR